MISRRSLLKGISSAGAVLSITPSTNMGRIRWSPPSNAIDHSGGRYSWSVEVDEYDVLVDWVDSKDDRDLLTSHEETGRARLVATPEDVGVTTLSRFLNDGLAVETWINRIEIDRTVSIPDPIAPQSKTAGWSGISRNEQLSLLLSTGSRSSLPTDGIAFEDEMAETTIGEVREITGATSDLPSTDELLVAVIDTGINDGEIFAGDSEETRISDDSKEFISEDEETGIDAIIDGNLHGTWCASAIASSSSDPEFQGMLQDATLLGLRALNDNGEGRITSIEQAILYASDQGADIINLSLGSPLWSEAIHAALEYAVEEGSIPIAAVGNDRQVTRWIGHPASSDSVIAVSAVTAEDPDTAQSAYFSNVGPHPGTTDASDGASAGSDVDIAAPGTEVGVSTPRDGRSTSTETMTGTSMASPVVAGIVGLLVADGAVDDLEDARDHISQTAAPIPSAATAEVGAGMIDARAALDDKEPDEDQSGAMKDAAQQRDSTYQALSEAQGRSLFRLM